MRLQPTAGTVTRPTVTPATAAWTPESVVCRLSYLNWMQFGWGALVINQFKGSDAVTSDGNNVLEYYSLGGSDEWAYVGYSALFFIAFLSIAWAGLTFVKFQKR